MSSAIPTLEPERSARSTITKMSPIFVDARSTMFALYSASAVAIPATMPTLSAPITMMTALSSSPTVSCAGALAI